MPVVEKMLSMPSKTPSNSPIMFELTKEAKNLNAQLFKEVNYDVNELIISFSTSEIGYGSEFRPPSMLNIYSSTEKTGKGLNLSFLLGSMCIFVHR